LIGDLSQAGEIAAKIGLSAVLAGAVGIERQWTGKWAGPRTHMLIATGATLITHISSPAYTGGAAWDGGRLAPQIVTGVGFICGGTILHARGVIHGLTTAAGLWVAAAVGIAIGAGHYAAGTLTTLALLIILAALRPLEGRLGRGHTRSVVVPIPPGQTVAQLVDIIETEAIETEGIEVARGTSPLQVTVKVRGGPEGARRFIEAVCVGGFDAVDESTPVRPLVPPPSI
jgi:putative Mg2+ transporter-C (MgtC) family protein